MSMRQECIDLVSDTMGRKISQEEGDAIISNITPPVALAAYAAASIAEDSPNKTGWAACQLGILAFIIPFAFCYDTGLLLQLSWYKNLISIMSGIAVVFGVGFSFTGYCGGKLVCNAK